MVNDYGVFVGVKGDRVVVRKGGEKIVEIAAGNISQVLIASKGVSLSSAFLRLMLKHRVDFVMLSGFGSPLGARYVEFPKRMKRFDMPKDPVNVFLNYGYGLLASDVWMAVEHSALEPYAGFLHKDSPRRPALIMDLMEEFRQPVVDRVVLRLVSGLKEKTKSLVEDGRLSQEGRKTSAR